MAAIHTCHPVICEIIMTIDQIKTIFDSFTLILNKLKFSNCTEICGLYLFNSPNGCANTVLTQQAISYEATLKNILVGCFLPYWKNQDQKL